LDPGQWRWKGGGILHSYTTKKGRFMCKLREVLSRPIPLKWHSMVAADYTPPWKMIWTQERPQKEAAFMWAIYHNAVAVNAWRNRFFPRTSELYPCYDDAQPETMSHKFFDCNSVQKTWNVAFSILYCAADNRLVQGVWPRLSWTQCILGMRTCRVPWLSLAISGFLLEVLCFGSFGSLGILKCFGGNYGHMNRLTNFCRKGFWITHGCNGIKSRA
jgi:hypothetical protein